MSRLDIMASITQMMEMMRDQRAMMQDQQLQVGWLNREVEQGEKPLTALPAVTSFEDFSRGLYLD
jgi:hypothetical protein